jgi:Ras-related protein Rab-2A
MAGPSWNYVLKFIITGERCPSPQPIFSSHTGLTGDAGVGKSSLLVRLTDQRFLANPDPTVRILSILIPCSCYPCTHVHINNKLGVEFGSKLITIPEEDNKVVKLQCA